MHGPQHALVQEGIVIDRRNLLPRIQIIARFPITRRELFCVPVEFFGDAVGIDDRRASAHEATLSDCVKNGQWDGDSYVI